MGGGRSNTVTQTSGVPEWLKPDVQRAFGAATQAHQAGDLSNVVGLDPTHKGMLQNAALGGIENQQQRLLSNVAGQQLAGQANTGTLGSARGDRAREAALADVGAKYAQEDLALRSQAAEKLQADAQRQADAKHQGLQRLFGYYGSGAAGQQQTQSGGGGK